MLTCRDAHALIVRTIDDDRLSADARTALRGHLRACVRCREEYETQHEVRRLLALQLHVDEEPPPGFEARLQARLHARLADAEADPSRDGASVSSSWGAGARRHSRWRWRAWGRVLLPIAATIALIAGDVRQRSSRVGVGVTVPAQSDAMRRADSGDGASVALPRHDAPPRRRQTARFATDVDLHPPAPHSAPALPPPLLTLLPPPVAADSRTQAHANPPPPDTIAGADTDTLADALKLTEAQRRQIEEINGQRRQALNEILERTRKRVELERHQTDAAIERVLTPEQRKQYREHTATRARERNASRGWTLQPEPPAVPLPPASIPPPF